MAMDGMMKIVRGEFQLYLSDACHVTICFIEHKYVIQTLAALLCPKNHFRSANELCFFSEYDERFNFITKITSHSTEDESELLQTQSSLYSSL